MIYVRAFKKEDYRAFEPLEPLGDDIDVNLAQAIEDSGLAVTGVREGKVVGCGGVHPAENKQGEVWLRLSKDCMNHRIDTLRWIREGLKIVEDTFGFEHLYAAVNCCFEKSWRMVEYLGFQKVQEKTHDGRKFFIYSKRVT